MYQLPQRSFATKGNWKVAATFDTKAPSAAMERRRLLMLRLLRLRERRVVFMDVEAEGKRRAEEMFKIVDALMDDWKRVDG